MVPKGHVPNGLPLAGADRVLRITLVCQVAVI
jgi:hypothetical protein